ncbi:hypothetical protein SD77_4261 [Bacillus badius]|uniref:Mobile element protein n=1 Tax=Bacillus badius TaxID=1455 RepID=A0ABR5AV02_BACBA|nr:hypothetical protein SD78_0566 [Bacillus badius]KIL78581.1 hypothetical protein SD77_4261 [Bacillus badius]
MNVSTKLSVWRQKAEACPQTGKPLKKISDDSTVFETDD